MVHELQEKLSGNKPNRKQEVSRHFAILQPLKSCQIKLSNYWREPTTKSLSKKYLHCLFKWSQQCMNPHTQKPLKSTMSLFLATMIYFTLHTFAIQIKGKSLLNNNDDHSHFSNYDDTPSTTLNFCRFPLPSHIQHLCCHVDIQHLRFDQKQSKMQLAVHTSHQWMFSISQWHAQQHLFLSNCTVSHSSSPISWFAFPLKMSGQCFCPNY